MRIRMTDGDLKELARLYLGEAAHNRRRAQELAATSQEWFHLELAIQNTRRAEKLQWLAAQGRDFILTTSRPFNGGPPSLMIVGTSNAADGSEFTVLRARRR